MKRIIIQAPEGITLEALTEEQQAAISSVFTQFVLPMPGTQASAGHILIDAVVGDNFDATTIAALGLPFVVFGLWQWDGSGELTELAPLDSTFIDYLPPTHTYDENGDVLTTLPPTLHLPHNWGGWPGVIL
jgi:hypothetical protein